MAHSTPSVWVRLVTAAFAAAECADPGPPVQANVAPMFRMAPEPPAASRRRCSSCEQKKVPSRTICLTARHPFGLMSSAGAMERQAALLIRLVTVPSDPSNLSIALYISLCAQLLRHEPR